MRKVYVQHNKICFACGVERHKKELGYDISTLKTCCIDDTRCPNAHQIPQVDLVELTTDSLRAAINESYEPDVVKSLDSMLGKTVGARVSPALGMHLLKFAEAEGIYSINATIIHILEEHFANNEIEEELSGSNFTHKAEPKARTTEPVEIPEDVKTAVEQQILEQVAQKLDEETVKQIRSVEPQEADDDDSFSF